MELKVRVGVDDTVAVRFSFPVLLLGVVLKNESTEVPGARLGMWLVMSKWKSPVLCPFTAPHAGGFPLEAG